MNVTKILEPDISCMDSFHCGVSSVTEPLDFNLDYMNEGRQCTQTSQRDY